MVIMNTPEDLDGPKMETCPSWLPSNMLQMTNHLPCVFSVSGLQRHAECLSNFTLSAFEIKHPPTVFIPDERLIRLVGTNCNSNGDHDDTLRDLKGPKMQTRPCWLSFLLLPRGLRCQFIIFKKTGFTWQIMRVVLFQWPGLQACILSL